MKRSISIVLVIVMALLMLMGCNQGDGEKDSDEKSMKPSTTAEKKDDMEEEKLPLVNPAGTFPIVNESVTLRLFAEGNAQVESYADNWMTEKISELTGLSFEFQRSQEGRGSQQVSLILAANTDLPDLFVQAITKEQVMLYGIEGIILALDDLIEEFGLNIKGNLFIQDEGIEESIKAVDGKTYGIPAYSECFHCSYSQRFWMNKQWLDNLGLNIPQTTDELYTVLKAFKENDANGNGDPNDEIPLSATNSWMGNIEGFLMNPFIFNNNGRDPRDRLMVVDGEIIATFIMDEYREGMKYANKLYDEELMHNEVFTVKREQIRVLTEDPNGCRLGAAPAGSGAQIFDDSVDGARSQFMPIAPLEGPEGVRQTPFFPTSVEPHGYNIAASSEYPEATFRLVYFLMGPRERKYRDSEDETNVLFGPYGTTWEWAEEGQLGLDGSQAVYTSNFKFSESHRYIWSFPKVGTAEERNGLAAITTEYNTEKILYDASKDLMEPYGANLNIPSLAMYEEELATYSLIKSELKTYVEEQYAAYVTGSRDIHSDADWEAYLAEFDRIGLKGYLELIQTAYDRQYK